MAEDSTQKLSWTAETSSRWIHVTPSNGVGSMEVTVKLDEAEATETELDGTIIFKCTEQGFEGIQKTVSVNREACKKKCEKSCSVKVYQNVTCGDTGNYLIDACGGSITVNVPYVEWSCYLDEKGDVCKTEPSETKYEQHTSPTFTENDSNEPKMNNFTVGSSQSECQCAYPGPTLAYVTIWQAPGPAYECQDFEFKGLVNNKITIGVGETKYVYYEPKIGYGTSFVITDVRSSDGTVATVSEAESSIAGHCLEIYGEKNGTVTASVDYTVNCEENCGSKEFFVEVTGGTKTYEITANPQSIDCSGGTVTFTAIES